MIPTDRRPAKRLTLRIKRPPPASTHHPYHPLRLGLVLPADGREEREATHGALHPGILHRPRRLRTTLRPSLVLSPFTRTLRGVIESRRRTRGMVQRRDTLSFRVVRLCVVPSERGRGDWWGEGLGVAVVWAGVGEWTGEHGWGRVKVKGREEEGESDNMSHPYLHPPISNFPTTLFTFTLLHLAHLASTFLLQPP